MPITDLLSRNANLYGYDVALVEINPLVRERPDWKESGLVVPSSGDVYRRQMTWKEFDKKANSFANHLLYKGIKKGEKVGILLMNCLEWLPVYFGILRTGAIVVPLNFRYAADEIAYCVDLADIDVLVFGPEFTERIIAVKDSMKIKEYYFVGKESDTPDFAKNYEKEIAYFTRRDPGIIITDEDDAAIYFSSGTTGFPKAILHNHLSLLSSSEVEHNHHGQTREDNFLLIPPLYHTGAKMHWFGSLASGSRAVILRGVKPEWIINTVSEEHCTIVWLLVPWAQDILDAIERGDIKLENYRLSQWRLMHIGAQPVPPSLIRRWKKYFPNHEYDTNYGLSESIGPGCVHLGVENINKVGAIGIPGYKWEVKIVDPDGNEVKQGEVGELCVKGRGVMKCYYKDPAATDEVLKDGWLYTGDMAMQDEDGFIFLVDRKKDVIISGGENIYPVQIEDFLRKHDSIKDVAVIGLPDARLGEITCAIIETKPGFTCTEDEINEFCTELPRYKRPRKIIFAEVPRNATGKIEKPKLRDIYAGGSVVAAENEI